MTLNPSAAQTIDVDGTVSFTATVEPDNATDKKVKWSVGGMNADAVKLYSDADCTTEVGTDATETLTVYAKGISAGSVTVTATSNADSTKSASCDVTVNEAATSAYAILVNTTTPVKFNDIDWYIIADNSTAVDAGTVTLLARNPIGASKFHDSSNGYSSFTVKSYLDGLTASGGFFAGVADAIAATDLTDVGVTGAKLWLLSTSEANNLSEDVRKCSEVSGESYNYWWLRSPGDSDDGAAYVDGDCGVVYGDGLDVDFAFDVRPALKLNLSSVIFSSESKTFTVGSSTVAVTDVTLNPSTAQTIDVDGKVSFTATVAPDNATDKKVKWSVAGTNAGAVKLHSDEACTQEVGTDATQTLTVWAKGISAGSATVTATSNADGTKSASCDVTVNEAAVTVSNTINALPAASDVTTDNKDAIEAARAAYNALSDDQKAKVSADTLKKLTDAEDKLVVLQVMSEVSAKTGSGMTYTGNPIQLINTPTTALPEGYTMKYAVTTENTAPTDEGLYTTSIPTATNAGTYNVWYMARGDEDHKDSEPGCVAVTIAPNTYFFTKDTDDNWTRGSKTSWHGTVDSETSESGTPDVDIFFGFKAVKVDGKILESTDHKATRDSIKLELLPSYLSTLNPGQHTVTVLFEDGAAEITFMIYAEDNPSGYYDAFEVTVISDEPVKPVPYRNGVSVSDHRKVDDLGNGKYRMYVDPELWNQYYFMVEPKAGYHIEYREAKGEIVDKGLHGGTIRVRETGVISLPMRCLD